MAKFPDCLSRSAGAGTGCLRDLPDRLLAVQRRAEPSKCRRRPFVADQSPVGHLSKRPGYAQLVVQNSMIVDRCSFGDDFSAMRLRPAADRS